MNTIRRFSNVAEASFARSVLEAAGINAVLADENAYTLGPQFAPWGIRLQVSEPDAERAQRVLDQQEGFTPLPDDFVPPPALPGEATTSSSQGSGFVGAFIKGGLWAIAIISILAYLAHAAARGLLILFAIGGIIGTIVQAIYNKGAKETSSPAPAAKPIRPKPEDR